MHYIIDGYNVINSSGEFSASSLEERRNRFVEFIQSGRSSGSLRNSVTVVFDCKSKNPYEAGEYNKSQVGDIEIIFSCGILSADDIIAELVDESQNPYEITVVTNDKGLRRRTSSGGAKHETVETFLAKGFKTKNIKRAKEYFDNNEKDIINKEFIKLWLKR
ncbi:MAG: NYN domain-containing protein [Endomicrobium sp.]|jgi:predicted RNA-binding protein with PIN domain|nr:NYN domain-containing protein [Endomicrobium sp.]